MKPRLFSSLGQWLWISSFQYYVAQAITAAYWPPGQGYSWAHNTISALGNTTCGPYAGNYLCSPLYGLMNTSLFLLGITTIAGATLLKKQYAVTNVEGFGFYVMMFAGVGTILVALFPENSVSALHILGAGLAFFLGNVSMIIIGIALHSLSKTMRYFSLCLGIVGLVALGLFVVGKYMGLGIGGMERVVAYPQSIWMIAFGIVTLINKQQKYIDKR